MKILVEKYLSYLLNKVKLFKIVSIYNIEIYTYLCFNAKECVLYP